MPAVRVRSVAFVLSLLSFIGSPIGADVFAQTLEQRLLADSSESLAKAALDEGDSVRGALVFHHSALTCVACHSVGDRPSAIGPDLAKLDRKTSDASIVESLLEPSKVIAPAYAMITVETADGRVLSGIPVEQTKETLVLRDAGQHQKLVVLKTEQIAARHAASQSIMPTGQMNLLADRGQFLDLVRYLIDLREGGPARAREIERSLAAIMDDFPEKPSPYRPVVQRGEIAVDGQAKYPRGIALGFVGGTVLFDADQLSTVAIWHDGFVKSSPQNYFGLYWHLDGSTAWQLSADPHPLMIKWAGHTDWQAFEPPLASDPNEGTRFDGYQIGRDSVRLQYRIRVAGHRIGVSEDVRAESRANWQGLSRIIRLIDLPAGAQVGWTIPAGSDYWQADGDGQQVPSTNDVRAAPFLAYQSSDQQWIVRAHCDEGAVWSTTQEQGQPQWRLISPAAAKGKAVELRLDIWRHLGTNAAIDPAALKQLEAHPPSMADVFDLPVAKSSLPPVAVDREEVPVRAASQRPAVNPKQNTDEFQTTMGRFLRFVVTATSDQSEPGIDELEIYGADPNINLARHGKASASSVISGYAIHQIKHLNDGNLGNRKSWISAEKNGGWAQIEFSEPVAMRKIVWARDRTGVCRDRLAVKYRIEVSDDGKQWTKVGDEGGRAAADGSGAINRNASPGYEMESIPLPFAGCRPSDIAFTTDGAMYALAMTEGQVWRSRTPPVDHPDRVNWQRYASGLYHPIGLAVVDNRLFVAQKPEITELVDRDGDGSVDHYRTVATGWGLSTGWHEYCFGLAADRQKNLWFALNTGYFWTNPGYVNPGRWRGSILRASTDTGRQEVVAKGCRVPNGVCIDRDDHLFFTDNQGDWIQACKLAHVVTGRFYGHPEYKEDALPRDQYPDGQSAIWFPYDRMRSISGPVYDDTQGRFGPFADQMFVGDVGYGANAGIMRVALEQIDGEYQGACFPFVDGQPLGCERMKFGPDNCIYIASLTSGLVRMRFVGPGTPLAMQAVRIRPGGTGFVVQLTRPLAANQVIEPRQLSVKRYHYLYTGNYGSPQAEEKMIPVEQAEISPDRTSITLTFPVETYPIGMVYEIRVPELNGEQGEKLAHREAWYTVQRIPKHVED